MEKDESIIDLGRANLHDAFLWEANISGANVTEEHGKIYR